MSLKILFIGDIVGKLARQALTKELSKIKKKADVDVVIANGENATHGHGITQQHLQEILDAGVDIVTLGDHTFNRKETYELLDNQKDKIIRPANYPPVLPGAGDVLFEFGSRKILVVNLIGRVFMRMNYDDPFRAIDDILKKYKKTKLSAIIVDFHAEATSEKVALGWHLDGKVSAVLGTHTHVPTADTKILPKKTAHVSDVGMVGAKNSVIGVNIQAALKSFETQVPGILDPIEEGVCMMNAVLIEINPKTMAAISIQRLDKEIKI